MIIKTIKVNNGYPNQIVSFEAEGEKIFLEISFRGEYIYASLFKKEEIIIKNVPIINKTPINIYPNKENIDGYIFADFGNISELNIQPQNIGNDIYFYYVDQQKAEIMISNKELYVL